MGADLTTEDCVLGNHDDELQRTIEEVLRKNVPCTSRANLTKLRAKGKRAWRAGNIGKFPRMSIIEHET